MALPCRMVRGVEGVGTCLFGTSGEESWGIDAGDHDELCTVFSPMDGDSGRLLPSVRTCHESPWTLCFFTKPDAGWFTATGSTRTPFPHLALRDGVIPRLQSCVCRAMAIARLAHLKISIPSSGAPPGQVPAECFPGGGGGD